MEEPSDDTPSVTPFGRASSLREGAGDVGFHSSGCSLKSGVTGDFHRPYGRKNRIGVVNSVGAATSRPQPEGFSMLG